LHRYADETAKSILKKVEAAIVEEKGAAAEKLMYEYEWFMSIANNMRQAVRPHAGVFDDDAETEAARN
jgi:hypothetical protein